VLLECGMALALAVVELIMSFVDNHNSPPPLSTALLLFTVILLFVLTAVSAYLWLQQRRQASGMFNDLGLMHMY
jgi:hypothetical protein